MKRQGINLEASSLETAPLNYAAFWIRAFAGLIDFIILLIPFSVVVSVTAVATNIWYSFFFALSPGQPLPEDLARKGPMLMSIGLSALILFGWLYFALLESSNWRGTLGKHMLGLYVGDERGNRIDFWRASQRFAGGRLLMHVPFVGLCYFIVDCLCIMVVPRNRAIHDVISRCLVLQESLQVHSRGSSNRADTAGD